MKGVESGKWKCGLFSTITLQAISCLHIFILSLELLQEVRNFHNVQYVFY
jgi:hypothetical protein